MRSTMRYMVALENGEIVKKAANGFESTGMFIVRVGEGPVPFETVSKYARVSANACTVE